ncbi:MAG TPA: hypothetical protein VGQ37_11865 [Vicinamibacterales bacterium]|jgi:hypothetical protein|nr:hypothetical protein [Vicinamibacterales bacterium]
MDAEDYPIKHLEQMARLATALKSLPAQVLDHWYSYESFGSWAMTLRFRGVALRVLGDGKERQLVLQRSKSKKAPHDWGETIWRSAGPSGESVEPSQLIEAIRSAVAA